MNNYYSITWLCQCDHVHHNIIYSHHPFKIVCVLCNKVGFLSDAKKSSFKLATKSQLLTLTRKLERKIINYNQAGDIDMVKNLTDQINHITEQVERM